MRHTNRNVPSAYFVAIKDGKVLFLRRKNTEYMEGKYGPVAGHVEQGETFTQCAVREAKEEIGITLDPDKLRVIHVTHRKEEPTAQDDARVDVFFTADTWEGEPRNMEPHKCDDLSWFPIDNLPDNTIPHIRHVIANILEKKPYSEFGWE